MSNLRDKIYDMHGKVSSLETWAESVDEKLDSFIKSANSPDRKCKSLHRLEKIGIGVLILLVISLTLNPTTAALAKQVVEIVKAIS